MGGMTRIPIVCLVGGNFAGHICHSCFGCAEDSETAHVIFIQKHGMIGVYPVVKDAYHGSFACIRAVQQLFLL